MVLRAAYIEILRIDLVMFREIKVLLRNEYAFYIQIN